MKIPYVFKKCTKCSEWLVACGLNFNKCKKSKYGLQPKCKSCRKIYYEQNKDKEKERSKKWRENNIEKKKEYDNNYRKNNINKKREQSKEYYRKNKENILTYSKYYYSLHKEDIQNYNKEYYKTHKEKIKNHVKIYKKEWLKTPNGKASRFNDSNKRRELKRNQGKGITGEQWLEMMKFFEFKCAYSNEKLNPNTRSVDHIIPLSKGGEHEIWNLVPMKIKYNSSKRDKDMIEWYSQQKFYSEEKLNKIYEWQYYAYNKWGEMNC